MAENDSTEFLDWKKPKKVVLPKSKSSSGPQPEDLIGTLYSPAIHEKKPGDTTKNRAQALPENSSKKTGGANKS